MIRSLIRVLLTTLGCFLWVTFNSGLAQGQVRSAGSALPVGSDSTPPNLLLIVIDDLGWADLGCYGNRYHESPRIDALAAEGLRYTDAYAASPVCSSTRASIMTGKTPPRVGITNFIPGHWRPWEQLETPEIKPHLELEEVTYAELLRQAGYATGYFGKWHLGYADHMPSDQGFDEAIVTSGRHFAPNFRTQPRDVVEIPEGQALTEFLTDRAVGFIESHRQGPFALQVSHYAVHIPLESEADLIAKYEAKTPPQTGVNNPIYAGMIEQVDRSVGRMLDTLDRLGLRNDTVVMFISDHGGLYRRFDGDGPAVTTNAPLRDEKGTLYEGGIRIPAIVRWPGVIAPGSVCSDPISTIDLFPTFAAIAGRSDLAAQIEGIEGIDLTPTFLGQALPDRALTWHYPHYHHMEPAGAIRLGRYKLIESYHDGSLQLYDLDQDVGETQNLTEAMPELARLLQWRLDDWRGQVDAVMPTSNPFYDPERADRWVPRRQKGQIDLSK